MVMDTYTELSKQCCFSSSQDSMEEQQLAYAISSSQDSCKDQSQAVSEEFSHDLIQTRCSVLAFGHIIVVAQRMHLQAMKKIDGQ